MQTQIFVNLPVKDLNKSVEFFTALGFSFDPHFTDENATCLIVGENIFVMLLVEPFFQTFTPKKLCNTSESTEVLLCLSRASRDDVDTLVTKVLEAGGSTPMPPKDYGFMYQHGFQDIDGHLWELIYMDPDSPESKMKSS
ncbi:VOC family protein [Chitinimonas sp. PSY-7]|uniref:VOC family protein n=1 Tax=Chitinimonas sp. PSY-7 TaxID=3459088 RepID=UPI00404010D0